MSEVASPSAGPQRLSLDLDRTDHLFLAILALAAVIFGAGRLGLLLGEPPTFATALFPPAGIALWAVTVFGYRMLPGVLIGTMLINLSLSDDLSSEIRWAIALGVSVGPTMQAMVGSWFIRGRISGSESISEPGSVLVILLLGGPVSCVISATVGIGTLVGAGVLPFQAFPWHWFTWWVGDTLGVLVFTPALLLIHGVEANRRRQAQVILPLLSTLLIAIGIFSISKEFEQKRQRNQFVQTAELVTAGIEQRVAIFTEIVESLQGHFLVSDRVTREEFQRFAKPILDRRKYVLALAWVPRISHSERAGFEAATRIEAAERGITDLERFAISEMSSGSMVKAGERANYFPVFFAEPTSGVIGFDLGSNPARRDALESAFATGRLTATEPIDLVNGKRGLLMVAPLLSDSEGRAREDRGVVVGVFRMVDLVQLELPGRSARNYHVTVSDADVSGPNRYLYDNDPWAELDISLDDDGRHAWSTTIPVAQRNWAIEIDASRASVEHEQSAAAWLTLIAGLAFTALVGGFCLVLTGRMAEIETLVDLRTRALGLANDKLTARNDELKQSNRELDRFAYVASHDLKAPLRAVTQISQWLVKDAGDILPEKSKGHLDLLRGRVRRMENLLDGILAYSRAGRQDGKAEEIDTGALVEEVVDFLALPDGFEVTIQPDMPTVVSERIPLFQVFQNLIGNAVKHHDRQTGTIDIGFQAGSGEVVFEVADDGPGIPETHRDRVFEIFETLRSRDEVEASGIGLSIVKKVIESNGGSVRIEPCEPRGTRFVFTWPKVMTRARGSRAVEQ